MHAGITRIESGTAFRQRPGRPVESWRYFEPTFPIARVDDAERLYRQVRSLRIYEGPSEVLEMIIADAL